MWNNHRIRGQKNLQLPSAIPNHMFSFPDKYGVENMGINITSEQFREVAELSEVLNSPTEFMDEDLKVLCERKIADPTKIESKDAKNCF
eukprot:gene2044-2323_t